MRTTDNRVTEVRIFSSVPYKDTDSKQYFNASVRVKLKSFKKRVLNVNEYFDNLQLSANIVSQTMLRHTETVGRICILEIRRIRL